MTSLPTHLRKRLEKAIALARTVAEQGARKALEALAVGRHEPHGSMSADERALRNRLRAHGRQLGDALDKQKGSQETRRLEREVAYEHWHRMLFARFLAENGLLIEPESQVAITIEECEELAREQDLDPWALAASCAQGMLPQIFRPDDPVLSASLPPETRQALQKLLANLEPEVFTAGDSLGWTYQFWQAAEKDAVNARVKSGEKITGETLPAVTQLFTEPYMVQFLLHNTIGAWYAGKILAARPELAQSAASEAELRDGVATGGYAFEYLRFVRKPLAGEDPNAGTGPWRPAAGTYTDWPRHARALTVLDPCCGSGHFLVAAFDLLVRLRQAEEDLAAEDAIRAVLEQNLFGLELDGRCTQIAAFHLALAAWKLAGRPIDLPPLQIACSGIGPNASKEEWLALAEEAAARGGMPSKRDLLGREDSLLSDALRTGLEQLHETFQLAPELGSLIDPAAQASSLYVASFKRLEPLLEAVLEAESTGDELHERAVAAQGMARAARILAAPGGYTLVVTNFPFLGLEKQSPVLSSLLKTTFEPGRRELATSFLLRCRSLTARGGTCAAVLPGEWTYSRPSRHFRKHILDVGSFEFVCFCGKNAFSTGLRASPVLVSVSWQDSSMPVCTLDARPAPFADKARILEGSSVLQIDPGMWRDSPAHRLVLSSDFSAAQGRLGDFADAKLGVSAGDGLRFERDFWELSELGNDWEFLQGPVSSLIHYGGRSAVIWWEQEQGQIVQIADSVKHLNHAAQNWQRGRPFWGHTGVVISQMGALTIYTGEIFDCRCLVIATKNRVHVAPLAAFALSGQLQEELSAFDDGFKIGSPKALMDIPIELSEWESAAQELWDGGLPEPQSDDPTQWLFHGHPVHADPHAVLQVAVARLVDYRWPAELDGEMRLAPEARALVGRCAELTAHADGDGIVCLSSIQGEGSGADRLRSLLAAAFGSEWSAAKEQDLLRAAGERFAKGKVQRSLEEWLQGRFFEEHCALFHARPFVWHVWDGLPGGFHALVNYHRLAGAEGQGRRTLEKLASTYLGEWIDRQRQLAAAGEERADGRLAAATALQTELRNILEGAPPYDLFVRWKPLHGQPLGWAPDINDGVRLNIRPFLLAKDVGKKDAGILRAKPDNTWCDKQKLGRKDRGKEPESLRPRHLFPWFWSCDPEQHPEHRLDFGAATPGSTRAGKIFSGERWNNLHYSRAAKEAARAQQQQEEPKP